MARASRQCPPEENPAAVSKCKGTTENLQHFFLLVAGYISRAYIFENNPWGGRILADVTWVKNIKKGREKGENVKENEKKGSKRVKKYKIGKN